MLRLTSFFTAAFLILTTFNVLGQGVTTGSITGTITGIMDGKRQPLAGATVKAISTSTGAIYGAITKNKGQYLSLIHI